MILSIPTQIHQTSNHVLHNHLIYQNVHLENKKHFLILCIKQLFSDTLFLIRSSFSKFKSKFLYTALYVTLSLVSLHSNKYKITTVPSTGQL